MDVDYIVLARNGHTYSVIATSFVFEDRTIYFYDGDKMVIAVFFDPIFVTRPDIIKRLPD